MINGSKKDIKVIEFIDMLSKIIGELCVFVDEDLILDNEILETVIRNIEAKNKEKRERQEPEAAAPTGEG